MKLTLTKFAAIFACVLCLTFSAQAQKRKTPVRKTRTTVAVTPPVNTAEIKAGEEKVSIMIKNISKFVYNLGIVGRAIEDLNKDIAAGNASQKTIDLNARNKQAVLTGMRNIRAGIAALEVEFRTKPALKNYLLQIQGITDMSGVAEDQASAGKFIDSGRPLLMIIEKLSDTLAALP